MNIPPSDWERPAMSCNTASVNCAAVAVTTYIRALLDTLFALRVQPCSLHAAA